MLTDALTAPLPPPVPDDVDERPNSAAQEFTIVSRDIYFEPKELTIPADQDVTVLLPNEGAAPHNFVIDELEIGIDIAPRAEEQTVINAPAGVYEYYCSIPGHREAGMVGTLTLKQSGAARSTVSTAGASTANQSNPREPAIRTIAPTKTPTPRPTVTATPVVTATPTPSQTPRSTLTPSPVPTPTSVPTATATPEPTPTRTPMPTETPTPTPATSGALRLLLATLPLAHQQCFSLVSEGFLSFDAVAQRLNDVPGAEQTLMNLGWSDGGYRQFGCDFPPTGSAGWIEVNAHVFDNSSSAQQAVSVFATARAAGTSLTEINLPFVGDEAVALAGPAINGTEYTIYASTGNIMLRVTGVSRDGDPSADVLQVMRSSIVEAGQ